MNMGNRWKDSLNDKILFTFLNFGAYRTLVIAMMGETGYFLAKKFDAALGLYFTGMVSFVTVDNAMGQPHNTAYLPMPMLVST